MPTYTVITDTHGSPWGPKTADFDLGDNTPSTGGTFNEPIHPTVGARHRLFGNHDVAVHGQPKGFECSESQANKIKFIALDSAESFTRYEVPSEQIEELVTTLNTMADDWNAMIFTHVPMFTTDSSFGECYNDDEEDRWRALPCDTSLWTTSAQNNKSIAIGTADIVANILADFNNRESGSYNGKPYDFSNKTGYIIGCFAGHVHNNIQRYHKGIYMETFMTNGGNSYTTSNERNAALYTPPAQKIEVDLVNKTVNGYSYVALRSNDTILEVGDTAMGKGQGNAAAGDRKFYHSRSFPKFRNARYVGNSSSASGGATTGNNGDGWWHIADPDTPTAKTYVHGINAWVRFIRFDADGKLRYYGTVDDHEIMTEIPNYATATISFDSESTSGHWTTWTFKNGLYNGKKDTPVYNYKSGSLVGLNGYAIVFDSEGRPDHMTHNGSTVSYGNSDNWINVTHVTVYWRGFGDLTNKDASGTTPQIGLDNKSFAAAQRIDLVRSTSAGNNWVPGREQLLTRVVGANNVVYWLQDGRLTDLTDAKVGI